MSLTIIVRQPRVRSAVLRDAQGHSTRVVLGGADARETEREMIRAAELDHVDLKTARMERSLISGLGAAHREFDSQ